MDTGISASLKLRYFTLEYQSVFDEDTKEGRDIYAIDRVTAVRNLAAIWNDMSNSVFVPY